MVSYCSLKSCQQVPLVTIVHSIHSALMVLVKFSGIILQWFSGSKVTGHLELVVIEKRTLTSSPPLKKDPLMITLLGGADELPKRSTNGFFEEIPTMKQRVEGQFSGPAGWNPGTSLPVIWDIFIYMHTYICKYMYILYIHDYGHHWNSKPPTQTIH